MRIAGIFRYTRCVALALAIASSGLECFAQGTSYTIDSSSPDCGTFSLYMLLAIEGHHEHINALKSHLPGGRPDGYSMAELMEAAAALGVKLTGVTLPKSSRAPDRPALVFLKSKSHGHYVVVRPVGHSGRLIQIIDINGDPIVMDAADFYADPQWTGLALVPGRRAWALPIVASLLFSICLACGLYLAGRLRQRRVLAPASPA